MHSASAYAKSLNAVEAAGAAARAVMEKLGGAKPGLIFLFASSRYHRHFTALLEQVRKITGTGNIVGASACGILTEEAEIERQPGLSLLALAGEDLEAAPFLIKNLQESNLRAGEAAAEALRSHQNPASAVFVFPDAFSFQSPLFFEGFENIYGYAPLLGGTAAEEGRQAKTYQWCGTEAAFDSVAGAGLSGPFRVETGVTRSCRPVGEPGRVTRADGHKIYEIDGRPAYDMLLESISQVEFENPEQIFERVFLGVPLKSFQTSFLDSPYLIRNIMGINTKKGMLTCVSPVEEGDYITFALRDGEAAREDLARMLEDLKSGLGGATPAAGLYFNCCARGRILYGSPNGDVSLIRKAFPKMPLAGFFTYGEIAPVDHVNQFHHHSGILTLFVSP